MVKSGALRSDFNYKLMEREHPEFFVGRERIKPSKKKPETVPADQIRKELSPNSNTRDHDAKSDGGIGSRRLSRHLGYSFSQGDDQVEAIASIVPSRPVWMRGPSRSYNTKPGETSILGLVDKTTPETKSFSPPQQQQQPQPPLYGAALSNSQRKSRDSRYHNQKYNSMTPYDS